jgi:hypothetical protein
VGSNAGSEYRALQAKSSLTKDHKSVGMYWL